MDALFRCPLSARETMRLASATPLMLFIVYLIYSSAVACLTPFLSIFYRGFRLSGSQIGLPTGISHPIFRQRVFSDKSRRLDSSSQNNPHHRRDGRDAFHFFDKTTKLVILAGNSLDPPHMWGEPKNQPPANADGSLSVGIVLRGDYGFFNASSCVATTRISNKSSGRRSYVKRQLMSTRAS